MFEGLTVKEARSLVLVRTAFKLMVCAYVVIGLTAGYRAWFQIKSLELRAKESILRSGSPIETTVVSYARVPIEVRLDLVQGNHSETLAIQQVPKNNWAFLDPRTRQASQIAMLDADVLGRFVPGEAKLRATATGRLQLGHLPAPVMREIPVTIDQ